MEKYLLASYTSIRLMPVLYVNSFKTLSQELMPNLYSLDGTSTRIRKVQDATSFFGLQWYGELR
jgi:hypothetical protein